MLPIATRDQSLSHGRNGFSVIELLASILLIAAIAVLSLPTFEDFSPHVESTSPTGELIADRSRSTSGSVPAEESNGEAIAGLPDSSTKAKAGNSGDTPARAKDADALPGEADRPSESRPK